MRKGGIKVWKEGEAEDIFIGVENKAIVSLFALDLIHKEEKAAGKKKIVIEKYEVLKTTEIN